MGYKCDKILCTKRWGEVDCAEKNLELSGANIREVLGEILYLVRFPLMTVSGFSQVVRPKKILTDQESLDLYDYFAALNIENDE